MRREMPSLTDSATIMFEDFSRAQVVYAMAFQLRSRILHSDLF